MEVEEETTINHLEEPLAAIETTTRTVLNETSIENRTTTTTVNESENKSISESNIQEEDNSPIPLHKSEDSEALIMAAVAENDADAAVCGEDTDLLAALSGGGDDVAAVECGGGDVAAVECGGGDDVAAVRVDGEGNGDSVEEVNGSENSVILKDEINVKGESIDNVEGDEAIVVVEEVVKEEEVIVAKEEGVGVKQDENTVDGVSKNDEKDTMVEDEEICLDPEMKAEQSLDTGIEIETEKSLDTEIETDKPLGTKKETEKSLDTEIETDKPLGTELETVKAFDTEETEKSLDTVIQTEKSFDTEEETKKSLVTEIETEKSSDTEKETEKSLDTEMEAEKSLDTEMEAEKSLDTEMEDEKSLDAEMENEKSMDTEMENEKSLDTVMENEKSLDTEMENEEEANLADEENEDVQEAEIETESSTKGGGGKRKRGGKTSKAKPRKTIEEDVCFICFDGGDLVLCDRRNCPKAYHPNCVNRDEAFFQSKGSWNCGWHLCSLCEKKAEYMCYTCTYSLCKACTKKAVILCVREKEKKGFCEPCMRVVKQIEIPDNQGDLNFDDKDSWEHLFKDYWIETKEKHNLSLAEIEQAKNPCKGTGKQEPDIKDDNDSGSDNPPEIIKTRKSKRNAKKQKPNKEDDSVGPEPENAEWVSKDLLEFVTHMRNGDTSVISQFEVQDMLLEYIKRNKLRDPNHKSQIICDARLENLFGKPRVAHIEMLKLLESHFLAKEESQMDDFQGTVVDTETSPVDDKDKKRKGRKKTDKRDPQSNREDYAAIDKHNISLIYLRRKLVEDLLDDMERFNDIVVGTFVRIRISGAHQKQDIYRLVQVTGTSEAAWYTLSKRTTRTMLEILNLDKTETISIDSISNQDFMEDECKRLRQSIKCGLISRLTVGDVLDKAMELQVVRVNDWFETETVRLNHLRDRASDLGRKKELRECVEKLNVLKTPEERARRLEEVPLVHDDPTMDPEYGSEDDTDSDDKKQDLYTRSDSFRSNRRGRDRFSPRGNYTSKDSWSGTPRSSSGKSHEFTESWSGTPCGSSAKNHEFTESWSGTPRSSSAKNHEFTESWSGTPRSSSSTKSLSNKSFPIKAEDATTSSFKAQRENSRDPSVQQPIILEKPSVASPSIAAESAPKINETEKMWHYKDPSEKIQGPFSMVQLRKWSKNGYFPVGLKIWRKSDKEDDGILLTDALEGKSTVVGPRAVNQDGQNLNRNLPSPTPNKVSIGQTAEQTGPLTGPSPPLIACGNKDGNLAGLQTGPLTGPTFQSHDPSTNTSRVAVPDAPQNIVQGVQNPVSVHSSQLGQLVTPLDSNMQPQMVQSVSGQNPQGWSQNMQPNPSMNMAGLPPVMYNQWTGVPNMVQNPVGNFMPAPQEPWAQQFPFPVNQPTMQQQLPQPLQPNVNWGAMAANPNMGWVGPNAGNPMNWVPMVPGPQVTGTVDPTWAMQAGWVPQPAVQGIMPNQSWVATPTQGPVVAGNGNPSWVGPMPPGTNQVAPTAGWVAPNVNQVPTDINSGWVGGPGNQGAPVPNQGWVPPPGTQGAPPPPPGNPNQNWGPRNRGGNWGGNRNRGGFGFGGRRSFNKQESFHGDGGSNDKDDDGPTHKDSGSFHGDDARSSDQ
ncbi:putative chromatin regulator PHD family [Helianthus annuus]|nr:putative chromatin regulator PHD family [Helianthus annuus]